MADQLNALLRARDALGNIPTLEELNNIVKNLDIQYDFPTSSSPIQIYYTNVFDNEMSTSLLAADISKETGLNSKNKLNIVSMADAQLAKYMVVGRSQSKIC